MLRLQAVVDQTAGVVDDKALLLAALPALEHEAQAQLLQVFVLSAVLDGTQGSPKARFLK